MSTLSDASVHALSWARGGCLAVAGAVLAVGGLLAWEPIPGAEETHVAIIFGINGLGFLFLGLVIWWLIATNDRDEPAFEWDKPWDQVPKQNLSSLDLYRICRRDQDPGSLCSSVAAGATTSKTSSMKCSTPSTQSGASA